MTRQEMKCNVDAAFVCEITFWLANKNHKRIWREKKKGSLLRWTFQVKPWKHKPFRSHSDLSSVAAAHGLDSVRPLSSHAERDFSTCGRGSSSGKIPAGRNKIYLLDVFEWIQSPQRGCHRSLAAAARRRKVCVEAYCCSAIPPRPRMLDYGSVGIRATCLQGWHSYIFILLFFSSFCSKRLFQPSLGITDSPCPSPDKI